MKKFMLVLVSLLMLFTLAGCNRGTAYYYHIEDQGTRFASKDKNGVVQAHLYRYDVTAKDAEGKEHKISFTTVKDAPLKMHAWLKLTAKNGEITSWEQVQPNEVPTKAR